MYAINHKDQKDNSLDEVVKQFYLLVITTINFKIIMLKCDEILYSTVYDFHSFKSVAPSSLPEINHMKTFAPFTIIKAVYLRR